MSNETVWLDALPQEVCVRIAANATQFSLEAALHIGKVSPTLRTAVLQALNHDFMFNHSRIFCHVPENPDPSDPENASASEDASASPDDAHSADDSGSESAQKSSDHGEPSPDVSEDEQSVQESDPSTPDPQLPHLPDASPEFNAAFQHMLRAEFGDKVSEWTVKETESMEEFFAHCEDDAQPSQNSAEVHSNQDAAEKSSDDENSHQPSHSGTEEQSDHEPDSVHVENRSDDDTRENASIDAPENRSDEGEETSESSENHNSCEDDSDAEAETSLLSDAEKTPDQETPQVPETFVNFHREFADFLGEDTRSMVVFPQYAVLRSQPAFQTCMASPLLEKLILAIPTDVYESFRVGPNLRSLVLMVAENDLPVVPYLQRLASTELRELELKADSSVCLHRNLTRDPETASLLSSWFPNLEKLDIECHSCKTLEDSPAPMWSVIKHFRGLQDVALYESVPEDAIEELQRVERVTLCGEELRDLFERIPDRIINIVTNHEWRKGLVGKWNICQNQLERLEICPRLEMLECCIKPGMERGFVRIVGKLTSLGLAFDQSEVGVGESGEKLTPLRPSEGAILDLVQAAPNLKSLRLANMRISRSELQEVLISAGDRLEVFAETVFVNSFMGQFVNHNANFVFPKSENQHELELFIAILKTAAMHNPRLKELSIDLRPEWFTDINAVRSIILKLQAACNVLTKRALSLDYRNLSELFHKFVDGEIGMVHLFQTLCGNLGIPMVAVG